MLHAHQDQRPQRLRGRQASTARRRPLEPAQQIAAHAVHEAGVSVEKGGDRLQGGLELHALPKEFDVGEGALRHGRPASSGRPPLLLDRGGIAPTGLIQELLQELLQERLNACPCDSVAEVAWACRNLLELKIQTMYVLRHRQNAQGYVDDMWIDGLQTFEAIDVWSLEIDKAFERAFSKQPSDVGADRASPLHESPFADTIANLKAEKTRAASRSHAARR